MFEEKVRCLRDRLAEAGYPGITEMEAQEGDLVNHYKRANIVEAMSDSKVYLNDEMLKDLLVQEKVRQGYAQEEVEHMPLQEMLMENEGMIQLLGVSLKWDKSDTRYQVLRLHQRKTSMTAFYI